MSVGVLGEAASNEGEACLAAIPFDLEAAFATHYPRVTAIIAGVVRDPSRAEELAVEVFLKLWGATAAHNDRVAGWLYRTAVRLAIDELRRQARRTRYAHIFRHFGHTPSPEETTASHEEHERVRVVLATLRREQAALLLLRGQDFSYQELADALALNPASVGTWLRRARQAFRQEYRTRYGDI